MYDINDSYSAIFAIQTLLRQSGSDVKPDGIYGYETAQAVRSLQIKNGIIPTGRVDLETFNALLLSAQAPAVFNCIVIPASTLEGGAISPGEKSSTVIIIQALLKTLEVVFEFEPVEVTGIYDTVTQAAVAEVQRLNGIEQNGIIDATTWNAIAREYEKYKDWE